MFRRKTWLQTRQFVRSPQYKRIIGGRGFLAVFRSQYSDQRFNLRRILNRIKLIQ